MKQEKIDQTFFAAFARTASYFHLQSLHSPKKSKKNGSNCRRMLMTPGGVGIGDLVGFGVCTNEPKILDAVCKNHVGQIDQSVLLFTLLSFAQALNLPVTIPQPATNIGK
jgi:hypothetical protein